MIKPSCCMSLADSLTEAINPSGSWKVNIFGFGVKIGITRDRFHE